MCHLSKAEATQSKLPKNRSRATAATTARVSPGRERFGFLSFADPHSVIRDSSNDSSLLVDQRLLCHTLSSDVIASDHLFCLLLEREAERIKERSGILIGISGRHDSDIHPSNL